MDEGKGGLISPTGAQILPVALPPEMSIIEEKELNPETGTFGKNC
ncbi:uncharacterized protein G2W53_003763 [Senna tora]|uniref:Uncharacterized protein n=1 Tax=Senna tora TaxID=362788 RepID=A0A834SUU8_9FABA|nr:uncharacterized protein G2W53_037428 [Senna tora]KAF7841465.1 uncharacterized protein G2W53_003763 [Senna tora]